MRRVKFAALLGAMFAATVASAAQFTTTQITINGSTLVHATSINYRGDITGGYRAAPSAQEQAFILHDGVATILPDPFPPSSGQSPTDYYGVKINKQGNVLGIGTSIFLWRNGAYAPSYEDVSAAALFDAGCLTMNNRDYEVGTVMTSSNMAYTLAGAPFTTASKILLPGIAPVTGCLVNNQGVVLLAGIANGIRQIYLWQGSAKVTPLHPVIHGWAVTNWYGQALNDQNDVAGGYTDPKYGVRGLVYHAGTYKGFNFGTATAGALVTGMNINGRVIGYGVFDYTAGNTGFLWNGKAATATAIPGNATGALPVAINNAGTILLYSNVSMASYILKCTGNGC